MRTREAGLVSNPSFGSFGLAARVRITTTQSAASAAFTTLSFGTVVFDKGGFYAASAPTRLTVPRSGIYMLGGQVFIGAVTGGSRILQLNVNGTTVTRADWLGPSSGYFSFYQISFLASLSAGDYVEMQFWHDTGAARNIQNLDAVHSCLWIAAVG